MSPARRGKDEAKDEGEDLACSGGCHQQQGVAILAAVAFASSCGTDGMCLGSGGLA